MQRSLIAVLMAATVTLCSSVGLADEGMWPLYALKDLDFAALKTRGLELSAEQIFNEKDGGISAAVVQVGGGTGAFVSAEGLIATNHHVAFGAIQKQSSVDQNYLEQGFLAKTKAEEIPAIGYEAYVTLSFKDVTKDILEAVKSGMNGLERYKAIDQRRKEIIKEAEKQGNVRCRVATFYGGLTYVLVTTLRLQDIRIVYIPPRAIGEFGGEIDNWMWPRHTGDFSFLRAYVGPDGKPATYAESNVPYTPRAFLPISSRPLKEGDFCMAIGYPGRTVRYRSSHSINESINHYYPDRIKAFTDVIKILTDAAEADSMNAIRLAGKIKGLNNALKNYQGMLRGLEKSHALEAKRAQEKELTAFLAANSELNTRHGGALPALEKLYVDAEKTRYKDFVLGLFGQCQHFSFARTLYKWSIEKAKKDLDREPEYMERSIRDLKRRLEEAQFTVVPGADQKVLTYIILRALRIPAGQRIAALDKQFSIAPREDTAQAVQNFVQQLIEATRVGVRDDRMRMFDMVKEQLLALNDPLINLARDLYDEDEQMANRDKAVQGAISELEPKLIEAYMAMKKKIMYPDANGTIRLTTGEVMGYSPADAVSYRYATTLTGVAQKETGQEPFASPKALLEVYKSGNFGKYVDPVLKDVPVCLVTTLDGTGGNSGSPVLNGKGELIGLWFDTNWEGVSGDWFYDAVAKREIIVDSRYILFILDRVYGAKSVLNELMVR